MAAKDKRNLVGLILVGLGVLLIIDNLTFIPDFIPYWVWSWPFLLVAIGVFSLLTTRKQGPGIVLIAVGSFFLFPRVFHDVWDSFRDLFSDMSSVFWYVIIIIVGLALIFKGRRHYDNDDYKRYKRSFDDPIDSDPLGSSDDTIETEPASTDENDYIDDVSVFGGSKKIITSKNFRGGNIVCLFGGSEIILSTAKLAPGKNVIEVFAMFGGWTLVVPQNWVVQSEAIAIFGGISDKRIIHSDVVKDNTRKLVIKGFIMFGGGEIKSY